MGNYDVLPDEQLLVRRSDGSWLVDGATPVDDIEREFDIESMPEEETYETVAGFMMYMLRRVPKRGDHVDFAGYRFEVTNMDRYQIDQVLIYRPDCHCHPVKKDDKTGEKHHEIGGEKSVNKPAIVTEKNLPKSSGLINPQNK